MKLYKEFMTKIVMKDIFLKLMVNVQKNCLIFIVIYYFYLKNRKSKIVASMVVPYRIRKQCCAYKSLKTGIKSWLNI